RLRHRVAGHLGDAPPQPSGAGALVPRRAGLHEVLRVEVRAAEAVVAYRGQQSQPAVVVKRLQRGQRGVQAEMPVEVHHLAAADRDAASSVERERPWPKISAEIVLATERALSESPPIRRTMPRTSTLTPAIAPAARSRAKFIR